ncbi:MAG: L,D-transpeptidase family protein [Halioglobus sp.]
MNLTIRGLLLIALAWTQPVWADLQYELQNITEHMVLDGNGQLPSGGAVYQPAIVEEFYYELEYQPAWKSREQAARVLGLLKGSYKDGLNPEDYHYSELMALWAKRDTDWPERERSRARFDVLLTDGVLLYIRHLLQGKVDPRQMDPNFNYSRMDFEPTSVSASLRKAIAEQKFASIVEQARPSQAFYQQMKAALAHYRNLDATRQFVAIPTDIVLKPGQTHASVPLLRTRLAELGYSQPGGSVSRAYDPDLVAAVRQFQQDHGLDADGVVGRQSYAFLNMTYKARVNSLRINMDRVRWLAQDITDDFIIVNIAGYEMYYIRGQELLWESPVMVGTIQHQTPIFTARLKYLEFNPIWTVPRSIIGRSLLPKFKANPQYVLDNNYHLYDRSGKQADPLKLDWASYNINNFPFSVVQQPGEKNALGRVKFIFPNRHAVYLHDTPARNLFSRSARAFSSGCVRVKHPLEFAEVLLNDPQNWSLSQVEGLVASAKPQERVYLDRDVDVMLMYWTTSPTRDGKVQFHTDIYGKDPVAIAALKARPQVM